MNTKHAKSPCCSALVIRYGARRRQCTHCSKTWRIRKKKRGRKPLRVPFVFARQYLDREIPALRTIAKKRNRSREALRRRFHRSLDAFLRRASWASLPQANRLIALADGMEERIGNTRYTVYLILVKSIGSDQAIILPPYLAEGHENSDAWRQAFDHLPRTLKDRISALVCDGHAGLRSVAIAHHWLIQRCHFHLLLGLKNYLSPTTLSRHKWLAFLVFRSVFIMLRTRSHKKLRRSTAHLHELLLLVRSRGARKVLSGFLKYMREYRTYLRHPSLNLPTTSNTCESFIQVIRDLLYRTRGFRTRRAFLHWLTAILLHKNTYTCRGFHQPN